ncbi:alpha-amylase family glycosyl hydrolase [Oceanobacillus alkalisoli]|uniref:alpha-amylase family glycosyl hydrolase n=1 Tax=Oceanobacillus alkalisoli TaxID=2925113 RepID=UPI001EEBC285|nr:alpha-amylase family glycosyl hydrolase [Oceanobacillus alkalisoli]MCF3942054.1 alpha-amylase [Oceanobacillus alkalisoli]MCG5101993.1 alpha-amylase family glycosyl hydrolase [Oceanobacillus alkalisoli]
MKRKLVISIAILFSLFIYVLPVAAEERQIEDEIMYEIMVDRYSNGDFNNDAEVDVDDPTAYQGGDFRGIIDQLDNLAQIGMTTIVLSPIMANMEDGFHGYWVEDFTEIDPQFGTFEELDELLDEAHERDIKIVLELVTNYLPEDHSIALDPERADWILPEEVTGPDWTERVVQLNQNNPDVQDYLIDAASFWLDETEIDGLSLHAVDQSSIDFLNRLTTELKESHPDKYLLGDVLDEEADIAEIMASTSLDAIDNYQVGKMISDIFSLPDQSPVEIYEVLEEMDDFQSILLIDDKYSKRFSQKFSENGRNTVTAWKLALTYMYTTPGTPLILQGTEVGMYGETAEDSQRIVPLNRGDQDLTEFHERISSLRTEFPSLRRGDFELVDESDSYAVFKRTYEGETMYIGINNGSKSSYIDVTDVGPDMLFRGYIEDNLARQNPEDNYRIGIPRESVEVYQLMDDVGLNWTLIIMVATILFGFVFVVIYLSKKQKERERAEANQGLRK